MKNLVLVIALFTGLLNISCKEKPEPEKQMEIEEARDTEVATPDQEEILTGKISRSDLEEKPYSDWFNENYKNYTPEEAFVNDLKPLLENVQVKIFMGTWCEDSQMHVPAFFKIADAAGLSKEPVDLIAVTRAKITPEGLEKGYNIDFVPTFIFMKDGKELGRIVELPVESLEKDMLKILKGEPYNHTYAN